MRSGSFIGGRNRSGARAARIVTMLGTLGLIAVALLIAGTGHRLTPPVAPSASLGPDGGQTGPAARAPVHELPPGQPARRIAEDLIAPPPLDVAGIERMEPRPPLGALGLASPPKTPMPRDWRETLLYRPFPTSSTVFEAMGRKVIISGTIDIEPDRTCLFGGAVWACGQRARAAFNAWMRGRALNCALPPDVDRFAIAAPCRLGKQDVGAWLVANGWAMASPSGIYGKAESVARGARMGIFGPPQ